jgi:hypothetical protein
VAIVALLAAHVASAGLARPHYLSYFNTLAGGSAQGYRWLVDSNVDWGQDLLRLRQYQDANHVGRIHLAYFGRVAPEIYGIDYEMLPADIVPGVYVISATYLMGRPYYLYDHGTLYWVPQNAYAKFQKLLPTARVGLSLFVFDLRENISDAVSSSLSDSDSPGRPNGERAAEETPAAGPTSDPDPASTDGE